MQRVIPSEAGFIALLSPEERGHVPLSRHGYDDRTGGYLDSQAFLQDLELGGQRRTRHPVQHVDSPVPQAELPVWVDYLLPAGFRGALGVALFTPDRRYLGLLGVTTERATPTGPDACNLAQLLAEQVAVAVDPLRSLAAIAGMVQRATAGIVLAPSGAVLPLPGLPDHRLPAAGAAGLTAVSRPPAARGRVRCPHGGQRAAGPGWCVRLVPRPPAGCGGRGGRRDPRPDHGAGRPVRPAGLRRRGRPRLPGRGPARAQPPRAAGARGCWSP